MKALFAGLLLLLAVPCSGQESSGPAIIHITGAISSDTADSVEKGLSDAVAAGAGGVVLVINSPGGEVMAGLRIEQDLRESPIQIACVTDGIAASMASAIFESKGCGGRYMTPNSILMFHTASTEVSGHEQELLNGAASLHAIDLALELGISERTGIPLETIQGWIEGGREKWVASSEALALGLVDKIL